MSKFQTTKKECQRVIDNLDNVCDVCGRKIKPIKTVNNAGVPTYWAGCFHGQKDWGTFTHGVKKNIYDLAVKLVLEDDCDFGIKRLKGSDFDYLFENAVKNACGIIKTVEHMKHNSPRYTKKQLQQRFVD